MKALVLLMIASSASLAFTAREHQKAALFTNVWKDISARKEALLATPRHVQLGTLARLDLPSLSFVLKEHTLRLSKWEAALIVLKAFIVQMKRTSILLSVLPALIVNGKATR